MAEVWLWEIGAQGMVLILQKQIFANFSYCTFTMTDPFYNFARPYVRTLDVNIMNQVWKNILNKTNELK